MQDSSSYGIVGHLPERIEELSQPLVWAVLETNRLSRSHSWVFPST